LGSTEKTFRKTSLFTFRHRSYGDWMDHVDPGADGVMESTGDWGYRVEKFEEYPGLYYLDKGIVNLYTTMWKTIVYIDLNAEDLEVDALGSYINHVDRLCNSIEVKKWTGCSQFTEAVADRFRHLRTSEKLLREIVGKGNGEMRQKRRHEFYWGN
jgi:hypothetical protein